MPNLRVHLRISRALLGFADPLVHKILDRTLSVEEHRRTHNPRTIRLIGELLGKEAKEEAWLHFLTDYNFVKFPI